MIKSLELEIGTITRAAEDEPLFVLRAKDKSAPGIVRVWVAAAELAGVSREKVDEALDLANQMERWAAENGSKVPD